MSASSNPSGSSFHTPHSSLWSSLLQDAAEGATAHLHERTPIKPTGSHEIHRTFLWFRCSEPYISTNWERALGSTAQPLFPVLFPASCFRAQHARLDGLSGESCIHATSQQPKARHSVHVCACVDMQETCPRVQYSRCSSRHNPTEHLVAMSN